MSVSILANDWLESKDKTMSLPIKKLDGVSVKMRIKIDWKNVCESKYSNMVLVIDGVFKCDDSGEPDDIGFFNHYSPDIIVYKDTKEWNIAMMEESLLAVQTLVGKLKYDKILNMFVSKESVMKANYDFWSLSNSELEGEICCVCHEMTTSKTECNHALCLQCWSQMPKIQAPQDYIIDSDMMGHNCPICRTFMLRFD